MTAQANSAACRYSGRLSALLLLSLLLSSGLAAAEEQDIVKPEVAFRYAVKAGAKELLVTWTIEPAHYLYRERMSFESGSPKVRLGPAYMPSGIPHEDEFFGAMEIYRDSAVIRLPLAERPPAATPMKLVIRSQGCADIGLCYPPQTWTTRVSLPSSSASSLDKLLGGDAANGLKDQPLPVAEAFRWQAEAVDPFTVRVTWSITPGYYLYRHTLSATSGSTVVRAGPPSLPPGTAKWDEEYGDTKVFYDGVAMDVPLTRASPAAVSLPLTIRYQGCKEDSICYPPQQVTTTLELPAADAASASAAAPPQASEQDRLFALIRDGNLLLVMLVFAGLGLLLSFTPCCLPMYPILSGIIVGQGGNVSDVRAFSLALSYVLGMALTYTIIGAVFAAAGSQVQAVFQNTWVIVGVAALFVALALSMFGLYDLQVPASWQTRLNRLSGDQRSGNLAGAAVMGMISAAVVTTCVTPPLVAALMVIAKTGDVVRGALALFALAIGMGIPLLAIGASAGRLMPRAGPWMVTVKTAFGLMMLGLAVWMLDRLWPGTVTLVLWAILLVVGGVFLGAFAPLGDRPGAARKLSKAFGIVTLLYGAALLIGALAGNEDPLRPLQFGGRGAAMASDEQRLPFTRIKTVTDLEREVERAVASGRGLMLDFYADWCASCKEMEKLTFPDPAVRAALGDAIALQADVTAVDEDDQQLLKRFGIIGPPTIVFFLPDGTEQEAWRVVGFKSAVDFAAHVHSVFGTN